MLIRFGGLLGLIAIAVWLWAIFDSMTAPAERIRHLPKAVWVIIVLLFTDLGAIAWFLFGRPRASADADANLPQRTMGRFGTDSSGSGNQLPRRSVAPDDDPDFLRRLGDQVRREKPDQGDEPSP
jgi:hypothetical protein